MPINRLLVASSAVYAAAGFPLMFAADEILRRVDGAVSPMGLWMGGMLGGALLAMALLNWFNRETLMGGIYGRPLLVGNLMLLTNITFSALRMWRMGGHLLFAVTGGIAALLLILFGRLLFRNPRGVGQRGDTSAR